MPIKIGTNVVPLPGKEHIGSSTQPPICRDCPDDDELVARIRKDDGRAADLLVRRYYQKAFAFARHLCSGKEDEAEELTQQAFLNAIRSIKKFKGNASFYTWFYRILVNTGIDMGRRKRKWRQVFSFWNPNRKNRETGEGSLENLPDPRQTADPESTRDMKDFQGDIRKALGQLSEKQRLIFQLKVFQEMSIREIAEVMQLAEGTVKSHLFRATAMMRKKLATWAKG